MDKKIRECEIEYKKLFCKVEKKENFYRFRDSKLIDMYHHNMVIFETNEIQKDELSKLILEELTLAKQTFDYFLCSFDKIIDVDWLENIIDNPDISRDGYYQLDDFQILKQVSNKDDLHIEKIETKQHLKDFEIFEVENYGDQYGIDFCKRRVFRYGYKMLEDSSLIGWLLYKGKDLIGQCDMFSYKGVVKIENFVIHKSMRNEGYGTIFLKKVVEKAVEGGFNKVYLVTDEDERAKELYLRLGFKKIEEWMGVYVRL